MLKALFILIFSSAFLLDYSQNQRVLELLKERGEVHLKLSKHDVNFESLRNFSMEHIEKDSFDLYLNTIQFNSFLKFNFPYSIVEPIHIARTLSQKQGAYDFKRYPSYSEYLDLMSAFAQNYPQLCSLVSVGKSVNNRELLFIRINSDTLTEKPCVLYTSSMHGDETGGFILMLRLIDYLTKEYRSDAFVTKLVDSLDIWINPLANPDGTYRDWDYVTSPVRFNANGIDLNRNFPNPFDPAKIINIQKENKAMIDFFNKHPFSLSANFHSGSEVVNYPWDWNKYILHPDNNWFVYISLLYSGIVQQYGREGYFSGINLNGITNGAKWYVITGGRQDYFTFLGSREVTIELDNYYVTPEDSLDNLWKYNYRSLLNYLDQANYGIHGKVMDYNSGDPVQAKVEVLEHDDSSSYVYSNSQTGMFYRFLVPGTYSLKISAKGYSAIEIDNLVISSNKAIYPEIKLQEDKSLNYLSLKQSPIFYPNPVKSNLYVENKNGAHYRIYEINGKLLLSGKVENSRINVANLLKGVYNIAFTNTFGQTESVRIVKE